MSEVELVDFKLILVCIYRSPHSDFYTFLEKLEIVIFKVQMKGMKLIRCGDWNINFLQDSTQLSALLNLLETYNLINTVTSPTRVTKNSVSLIDVMITDKVYYKNLTEVLDLGYSNHLAQILHIKVNKPKTGWKKITRRQFSGRNIEEFNHLLEMESWEDVLLYDEVNTSYNTFLNRFLYYFERSFPLKTVHKKNHNEIKWIIRGIKVSSQKMRLLNTLKKNTNLSNYILEYINRYQKIYKSVITEAKRKENDRFMLRSHNKTKAIWQIINKETGSFRQGDYITSLKNGSEETSNQQKIADMLNSFFIESIEDLLANNINHSPVQTSQQRIQYQMNTVFWLPITEIEIERVMKSLRGFAGFDEIPEYLAKRCSQYIKKPLVHIFNASLKSGVFPDKMKIAKVRPLYKKGERHEVCNYRPIAVLSVFSKILEKLVYNRLISFVTKYAILTEVQNGFRKNKSTETAS
ncbi:hypothetical protein B7P43_G18419 [Cryptotermes secundus]|uniref:Reverse transcriptase domain-containing protein n=1 Tax=Cryptotermes secundus TaxID=105785 RepID=A0A2J7PNQ7_9NEOP|nr:hypothetical protein B7P43_G18419 [Cryptotermes secundus]